MLSHTISYNSITRLLSWFENYCCILNCSNLTVQIITSHLAVLVLNVINIFPFYTRLGRIF